MPYKDPEKQKQYWKEYRKKNRERINEYFVDYFSEHKEKRAEYKRRWKENNRDKWRADKENYRASKLSATPSWVDKNELNAVYKTALDAGMHVDHIIPLVHPDVCGLHVPWNLQLLTPSDNCRKGNRFER